MNERPVSSDPSTWQVTNYGANSANLFNPTDSAGQNFYYDPESGNLYDAQDPNANIVANKAALELNGQGGGYQNTGTLYEDPYGIQSKYNLQQSNPNAYNQQQAQELANGLFGTFTRNGDDLMGTNNSVQAQAALDQYKTTDPAAYYNAMLGLNLNKAGWDAGQGKTNADTQAQIQNYAQNALANGMTPEQIQNLIQTNYAGTAKGHAANIANRAQGQGTLNGLPQFAALSLALGSGLGAGIGALGLGAEAAGAAAMGPTAAELGYAGLPEFAGPTYGELGYTGLADGAAGPSYAELGFNGLNQGEAIAGANAQSAAYNLANNGYSAKDALSNLQSAKQVYGLGNTLANMLRGGGSKGSPMATNGTSQQQIAQYLNSMSPAQEQFGGLYESNKNPFSFTQQQPIQTSQNKISSLLRS
jgi:hypothetical protein